ncbi:MAG: ParB/RepB/Spo0J family partition protein [Geobacteraceae bacterium]|nr:ParB/RepB/Spo0J family partition protein [Geobacteraceae bacterium]
MLERDDTEEETGSQMQLFEVNPAPRAKAAEKPVEKRETRYQRGRVYLVALQEIALNPEQPRRHFDETDLRSLAASIRTNGLLQPILCQTNENGLRLVAGERRLRAAGLAGQERIPVRIVTGDPLETALIENLLRTDLTAVEEAEAIAALKERKGYRLEDLAGITGKAVPTLSEIMAVTRLPAEIRDACRCIPSIPRDILVMIARLPGQAEMVDAFRQYHDGILNRESLAARARKLKQARLKKPAPHAYIRSFTKRFSRFDVAALDRDSRKNLRSELEKLMASIAQALENLK